MDVSGTTDRKQVVTNLSRCIENIKIETQTKLKSKDYGLEKLISQLNQIYPLLDKYMAPEFTPFQVDIYPIIDLFAYTSTDQQFNEIIDGLMRLLPLIVKQLVRTVPNVALPFFKQISKQMYVQQPGNYVECLLLISPDYQVIQNYIRLINLTESDDQEQNEKIQLLERICTVNCLNLQELLLETSTSADEELALASFSLFFNQDQFVQKYTLEQEITLQHPFIKLVTKLLKGLQDEVEFAIDLLQQYVSFEINPFATHVDLQEFTIQVCVTLNKYQQLSIQQIQQLIELLIQFCTYYDFGHIKLKLNVQTCMYIINCQNINQNQTIYNQTSDQLKLQQNHFIFFIKAIKHSLIDIFIMELDIKTNYSQEEFKTQQFTIQESYLSFNIQIPKYLLDQKLSCKIFDFCYQVLNKISYDQQKSCHDLVVFISSILYKNSTQFIYDDLLDYLTFNNDFDNQLQVFEQLKQQIQQLNINSVNTLLNDENYNQFIQHLDDVANAFLILNMFILINVLPPVEFLQQLFKNQLPLPLLVCVVDNLVFAFHSLKFVAINEQDEITKRRELCQVLLVHFHKHLCDQATVYHELITQPIMFEELCQRILYLQEFIYQISQQNKIKINFDNSVQQPFVLRVIQIIKDQSLHELHYPACRCLQNINFNDTIILEILLPVITYIQCAIGDYLLVLVSLFLKISNAFPQETIQELVSLSQNKSQKILLLKSSYQLLVQLKHKMLNIHNNHQLQQIIKFLVQFLLISFYDDEEQVQTACFDQLNIYKHHDIGQLLNNCLLVLPLFCTQQEVNLLNQQLVIDLINSINNHIIFNHQILISYIDTNLLFDLWAFVELNFNISDWEQRYQKQLNEQEDDDTEQNIQQLKEQTSLYTITQCFTYNFVIKLVASAELLLEQEFDNQEINFYFTDYVFDQLNKLINLLTYYTSDELQMLGTQQLQHGNIQTNIKINSVTSQLSYLSSFKLLTDIKINQQLVFSTYTKLIQILNLITSQFIGLSIQKFQTQQINVYNVDLQQIIQYNLNKTYNSVNVLYSIKLLSNHINNKNVQLSDIEILDLFDLSSKAINNLDLKYDIRCQCCELIEQLSHSTRSAIIILHGYNIQKEQLQQSVNQQYQYQFWGRFEQLRESLKFLNKDEAAKIERSLVQLLEILSLGCLYQMQQKLTNFSYITLNENQKRIFDEIINFDILKAENKNQINLLQRNKISKLDKKLSKCINQLIHVFGHDKQQLIDQQLQEIENANLAMSRNDEDYINQNTTTQLEQAVQQIELFSQIYEPQYKQQLNTLITALTFSSLTYLINSNIQIFNNYLQLIKNIFETKLQILEFPHFIEFLEQLHTILQLIMREIALKQTYCLIFAQMADFLCIIYDKIIFENINLKQEEITKLKEIVQLNIAKILGLFIPIVDIYNDRLQKLCAFNYVITFPFTQTQIEHLQDVFGIQNVVIMQKLSIESILQNLIINDNTSINQYILNQQQFGLKYISNEEELISCYNNSAQALLKIEARYFDLFDQQFVDLCLKFLDRPIHFVEFVPFQTAVAQFVLLQRYKQNFQIQSLTALKHFSQAESISDIDVQSFFTEQLNSIQNNNLVTEKFLSKLKQLVQISLNAYTSFNAKTNQQQSNQSIIMLQNTFYYLNVHLLDIDKQFEKTVNPNYKEQELTQIRLKERFYGIYMIFIKYLMKYCQIIYLNNLYEIKISLQQIMQIIEKDSRFSVQLVKILKECETGILQENKQEDQTEDDVLLWC